MEMVGTSVCVREDQIRRKAAGKGGLLGKLLLFGTPLTLLRLEYLKYYRVPLGYEVSTRVFPARRKELSGSLEVIVEAMTGKCAMNNASVALQTVTGLRFMDGRYDLKEEEALQLAKNFAVRVVTRLAKGVPRFHERCAVEAFYRPHYIAYYGNPEDKNCRYLPFEADGQTFKR